MDWFKVPLLGEPRLSFSLFGDLRLSHEQLHWGPVVLFLTGARDRISLWGNLRLKIGAATLKWEFECCRRTEV